MAGNARRAETRIGHDARTATTRTLDAALREGRLDLAEYERRLVVVQAARVRKDLTAAVADLPGGSGRPGPGLRISAADRERALVRLAGALTDGRMQARAYADAEELLNRAVTYADVDAVVGDLDAKASHAERDQVIARIEAAVAGGLLDPAEQHDRVAAARRAATDAQLSALVADLPAGAGAARSPRASHADREAVVAHLHDAVEAGVLDLPEFDERVRAVYAARLRDELTRVVADLPVAEPAPAALPPAPTVDVPPPAPSPRAGRNARLVAGLAIVFVTASVVVLGALGFAVPAVLAAVAGAIVLTVLVVRSVRTSKAAAAADPAAGWTSKGSRRRVLGEHEGGLLSLAGLVLPDGTPVAITGGRDNTAKVWDLTDGSLRHTLSGHIHNVAGVAAMVLPDGVPVAVTVSPDRTAKVWDLRDGSQRGVLPKPLRDSYGVRCLSLADGTPVAIAHNRFDVIRVWDLRAHEVLDLPQKFLCDKVVPVVLPDGTPIALGTDWEGRVKAVDLETGKTRFRLLGHTDAVHSIDSAVLPDGTPVAVSASADKTVRVWDLRRRTLLHTIAGLTHAKTAVVCTSLPDGTPVAVASDYYQNTTVWDLRDGSRLPHQLNLGGEVIGAVALPDRTWILGPDDDGCSPAVHLLT
jgi:hypothetical protein